MPPIKLGDLAGIAQQMYFSGSRRPFLCSYKLTYACNLRCIQCPFHAYPQTQQTFTEVVQTLEQLKSRGNRIVVFEGGEPFLWKDGRYLVGDIIEEARRRFLCVGMTTNGTLPLDASPDILWVSIDGIATTHDRLRGEGTFTRVIQNIKASSHPRILAHITVNAVNVREIPTVIAELNHQVKGFTLQFYYPYSNDMSLLVSPGDRSWIIHELIRLKAQGYRIFNSNAGLRAMEKNSWECVEWLVDNVNPDGLIQQGCYLKDRTEIECSLCGFTPFTEMSLSYHLNLSAILTGFRVFFPAGSR